MPSTRILIMGLPGSGKTTLAHVLSQKLNAEWFNADLVRKEYNDWDFSLQGRLRQSNRLRSLCILSTAEYTVADFVCPTPQMRTIFDADITIWVDTIKESQYSDTNKLFVPPARYDFHVTTQDAEKWADEIYNSITNEKSKRDIRSKWLKNGNMAFNGQWRDVLDSLFPNR